MSICGAQEQWHIHFWLFLSNYFACVIFFYRLKLTFTGTDPSIWEETVWQIGSSNCYTVAAPINKNKYTGAWTKHGIGEQIPVLCDALIAISCNFLDSTTWNIKRTIKRLIIIIKKLLLVAALSAAKEPAVDTWDGLIASSSLHCCSQFALCC